MRRVKWVIYLSIMALIGPSRVLSADVREQLQAIEGKVKEEKVRLKTIEDKRYKLALAIKGQRKAVKDIEVRRAQLESELSAILFRQHTLELQQQRTNEEVQKVRELAGSRLRGIYLSQRSTVTSQLLSLLNTSEAHDSARMLYFLTKLREADNALLQRFGGLLGQAERELQATQDLRAEKRELEQQFAYQGQVLQQSIDAEKQMLLDLAQEQEASKASLKALRAEAMRLEQIVFTITEGQVVPQEAVSPRGPRYVPQVKGGSKSLTGEVLLPVAGSVVQLFGKRKVSGFNDFVFAKGIEFAVNEGGDVRAVLDGTVKFAGPMPGYDLVLIIDHGDRDYSLYGRLQQASVQVGQQVSKGSIIAKVAPLGEESKNFYFEFRRGGMPQDPLPLFVQPPQITIMGS